MLWKKAAREREGGREKCIGGDGERKRAQTREREKERERKRENASDTVY